MASGVETTGVVMPDAGLRFWAAAPSPNRGGTCRVPGDVRGIVIHSVEGSMASAVATFAKDGGSSAHYGIDTDGTVVAFVPEGDVAFHVAAFGNRPALNRQRPEWLPAYDGRWSSANACTVGIELAGFAGRPFTSAQYESLGALCAGIALRWGFVPDATRVVSHASLQSDRSDPGDAFDWETLFAVIQASTTTMAALSDGDREIIEVVRGLGADAAGVRGWVEKLGAYEAHG
jgi:N-acetyl-anhydromuramyl-L-alanine amidase AmpD